ncbi:MAG: thiamine-phosphate kinase [Beijerinckiaceae bacterium]
MSSGEDDLIDHYFGPIAGPGSLALRDDAACITPPAGCDLVITVDGISAGRHFFPDDPPASVARKALRVNLSDLAAKGADPLGCVLTLALPAAWTAITRGQFLGPFAQALGVDTRHYGCPLLGGDSIVTDGPLTISITAFGAVPKGQMVPRTGAKTGDVLLVTGTIGDAALGLQLRTALAEKIAPAISEAARDHLRDRYLHPDPRHGLASAVRGHAHAAMDISDGLVGDCEKMLRVSGVGGTLGLAAVPLSPAARSVIAHAPHAWDMAMTGGDDYEILASVPRDKVSSLQRIGESLGIALTEVGSVGERGAPFAVLDAHGHPVELKRLSYSHF